MPKKLALKCAKILENFGIDRVAKSWDVFVNLFHVEQLNVSNDFCFGKSQLELGHVKTIDEACLIKITKQTWILLLGRVFEWD